MKFRLFLATAFVVVVAVSSAAKADGFRNWTRCTTQSNGYNFEDADQSIESARARTIQSCMSALRSDNGQCRFNVNCDYENPNQWARCETDSNGVRFYDGGADLRTARASVVQGCTSSLRTDSGMCRHNVRCNFADRYRPWVRCETQSRGMRFFDGGEYLESVRNSLIQLCSSNLRTDSGECRARISCDASSYPPRPNPVPHPVPNPVPPPAPYPVPAPEPQYPPQYPPAPVPGDDEMRNYVCSTRSRGRSFSVPGRGFQSTRSKVVAVCSSNGYTDPRECDYNARCQ